MVQIHGSPPLNQEVRTIIFLKCEDNNMKSPSIVVAILLTAAMNLAYSGNALDGTERESSPLHYIGSKIGKNGSEVTIYKDGNGNFIAINPDNEPPNHYKKSSTLEEILEFVKMDGKENLTDHLEGNDQTLRKKTSVKIPKKVQKVAQDGNDRILREKTSIKTPNIKMPPANSIKLVQRNGIDKVYVTVTKKGTGKIVKIYKALNNDWIASDEDGNKVRYGSRNSLKYIVYEKEHHVGPISKADKYQIDLDTWKRSEATKKSREAAQEKAES
jgi:hypothetical protein